MVLEYYLKLGIKISVSHVLSQDLVWDFIEPSFTWSDGYKFQWEFDTLTAVGLDTCIIKHKNTWSDMYVLKAYSF